MLKDRLYIIFCRAVESQPHVKFAVTLLAVVSFVNKFLKNLGMNEIGNRFDGSTDKPELSCVLFEFVSPDIT